jgi:phenylpropionate dioxygenase-like ring-hydroxylating dioxygenase large terminal subunit
MIKPSHPQPVTLIEALVERAAGNAETPAPLSGRVPTEVYTDQARFELERDRLFRQQPLIIGHESQLPEPGDAIVFDWLDLPLLTIRDKNGDIGTFMNVCRHRGMRLVQEEGRTLLRSLVCPYHQWTYGLNGTLRNIPLSEGFAGLDTDQLGLVALPTEVRHGLIWVLPDKAGSMDLDHHLAGLGNDLAAFTMSEYVFCEQSIRNINCNWKLIQDAFLDGYHVVRLHKNTVGPFFPDAMSESDTLGTHIRSAVARNEIFDAVGLPKEQLDLRRHATFSYTVFPNSVLIFHPDYTSIIKLFPLSPDQTIFIHTMLTPKPPATERERDHFKRSFELIDSGVFEAEDIFVSVGTQRGLRSGANKTLLFGAYEEPALKFHEIINRALS